MGASGRNAFDARHIRPLGRFLRICTGNEHVFDSHAGKKASFAWSSAVDFAAMPGSSKTKTLSFDTEPVHTNDVTLSMTPCQQKNLCSPFIPSFGIPSLSAGPGAKPRLAYVASTVSPTVQRCLLTGEKKLQ